MNPRFGSNIFDLNGEDKKPDEHSLQQREREPSDVSAATGNKTGAFGEIPNGYNMSFMGSGAAESVIQSQG